MFSSSHQVAWITQRLFSCVLLSRHWNGFCFMLRCPFFIWISEQNCKTRTLRFKFSVSSHVVWKRCVACRLLDLYVELYEWLSNITRYYRAHNVEVKFILNDSTDAFACFWIPPSNKKIFSTLFNSVWQRTPGVKGINLLPLSPPSLKCVPFCALMYTWSSEYCFSVLTPPQTLGDMTLLCLNC